MPCFSSVSGSRRFGFVSAVTAMTLWGPASARGATEFAYGAGSGASTSYLVVDFAESAGDAYVFSYAYDTPVTGLEMLQALDAAGSFGLFTTFYPEFNAVSVDGFAYDGITQDIGFDGVTGRFWSYFLDGGFADTDFDTMPSLGEAIAAGTYSEASVGAGDRLLSDGSVDGWIVNVSSFNSSGATPTDFVPAAVPEPSSVLAVAGLGGFMLTRRARRGARKGV